jgi:hypothetical protein
MKKIVLLVLAVVAFGLYEDRNSPGSLLSRFDRSFSAGAASNSTYEFEPAPPTGELSRFHCDGREYCSQMTSRAEAIYFISNCPNTKMDGDNDGDPCENDSRF